VSEIQEYRDKNFPTGPTFYAVQLTDSNGREIAEWCGGVLVEEIDPFTKHVTPGINVPTRFGNMRASLGDYVFRRVDGSFDMGKLPWFEERFDLDDPETDDDFVVPDPDPHLDWSHTGFISANEMRRRI
jgi:hypothetical protein